jgi:hypothetical protein
MRRDKILLLAILFTPPAIAKAQDFPNERQTARAFLVVSDGAGPSGGGLSGATGLSQIYRASGTLAVTRTIGIEVSALRIQEIYPANRQFNDPSLNSPKADGLLVAIASLSHDGREWFPASAVIGGGVMKRPTNDPTKRRLTGGFMAGIEGHLWSPPVDWADFTAGARVILVPTTNRRQLYIIGLTLGLRVG